MHSREVQLYDLLSPTVTSLGYELLGVELNQRGKRALLRLYIDSEQGIGIDDCERASHRVSGVLDVEDPIASEYDLEVSSPGFDRPLFRAEHYARHIGSRARVRLSIGLDGRRNFAGAIVGVDEGEVEIEDDEGTHWTFALDNIERARLVPEDLTPGRPGSAELNADDPQSDVPQSDDPGVEH